MDIEGLIDLLETKFPGREFDYHADGDYTRTFGRFVVTAKDGEKGGRCTVGRIDFNSSFSAWEGLIDKKNCRPGRPHFDDKEVEKVAAEYIDQGWEAQMSEVPIGKILIGTFDYNVQGHGHCYSYWKKVAGDKVSQCDIEREGNTLLAEGETVTVYVTNHLGRDGHDLVIKNSGGRPEIVSS